MQCPRCKFENMPGQTACFRCGSVLESKSVAVDLRPPRAPGWKKPVRRAARWLRLRRTARKVAQFDKHASARAAALGGDATEALGYGRPRPPPPWVEIGRGLWQNFVALALSIIPGGAQLVRHRFRPVALYVLSWFVSLALGIFFFGSSFGIAAVSSAIVLHAWITMDAVPIFARPGEQAPLGSRFLWRLVGVAAFGFLACGLYWEARNLAAPGIVVGASGITVPALNVALRDSILCKRLRQEPPLLKRGDLVLVRVRRLVAGGDERYDEGYSGETIGQLVGLPGDAVQLTKAPVFIVNDQALDAGKFPVPMWLKGRELATTLGKTDYFVTMEYQVTGHGVVLEAEGILYACEFERDNVLARGFMRWFPLRKRGLLKELE